MAFEALLATLAGTQSADLSIRSASEHSLTHEWVQPGRQLAPLLAAICTRSEASEAAIFTQLAVDNGNGSLSANDYGQDSVHAVAMRQLAAILLRQYVNQYWNSGSEQFVGLDGLECPQEDKALVRSALNPAQPENAPNGGLLDPQPRVRVAVAMCVAAVAQWDLPNEWPEILPGILAVLQNANTALQQQGGTSESTTSIESVRAARAGCMRCLAFIMESDLLGDDAVAHMVTLPGLFDQLLVVFATGADGSGDRALQRDRAMSVRVLTSVMRWLAMVKDAGEAPSNVVKPIFEHILPSWIPGTAAEFERTDSDQAAGSDCAVKIALLELFCLVVGDFPKRSRAFIPYLVGPVWTVLGGKSAQIYEELVVHSTEDGIAADEEGDILGRETLALLGLAFIRTCFEQSASRKAFTSTMNAGGQTDSSCCSWAVPLAEMCTSYMQITASQMERWEDDANEFVIDEDDDSGVRPSAASLLNEVCASVRFDSMLPAVLSGILNRLSETDSIMVTAMSESVSGGPQFDRWWKLREACLFGFSGLAPKLCSREVSQITAQTEQRTAPSALPMTAHALITQVLFVDVSRDSGSSSEPGFALLVGAALRCAAQLLANSDRETAFGLLQASAGIITSQQDHSIFTSVSMDLGACRCVAKLFQLARGTSGDGSFSSPLTVSELEPYVPALLTGILSLFQNSSAEVLHLYLDTLAEISVLAPHITYEYAATILPYVLSSWMHNIADPAVAAAAYDLLKALASMPACVASCLSHILPVCNTVLSDSHDLSGLTAGAIALVGMLVKSLHAQSVPQGSNASGFYIQPAPELCQTFSAVARVVERSDDSSILQEGCDALCQLVQSVGGAGLMTTEVAAGDGSSSNFLQLCVNFVDRLLQPELSDTAALQVGPLISTLIRDAANELAGGGLDHMLVSVCRRLGFAGIHSLKQPLVCVFARLIQTHPDLCISFLANHTVTVATDLKEAYKAQQQRWALTHGHETDLTPIAVPTEERNALYFVLQTWCDIHEDISGAYYLKLSVVSLCKLIEIALGIVDEESLTDSQLRTASQQALASCQVLGDETEISKNTNANTSRPHTRSRGQIQIVRNPEPFVVRALSIVLREFSVACEQEGQGDDEDFYGSSESDDDGTGEGDYDDDGYAAFVREMQSGNFAESGRAMAALGIGSDELGLGIRWDDTEDALDPDAEVDAFGLNEIKLAQWLPQWVVGRLAADAGAAAIMQTQVGPALNPVDQGILGSILSSHQT